MTAGSSMRPASAVVFTTAGFVALVVAGSGLVSLAANAEVIGVTGLGALPGVIAVVMATIAYLLLTWRAVRGRPSYGAVAAVVIAVFLAHLVGLWLGALAVGVDVARASAAVGGFVTSPFVAVPAAAAGVASWIAVALVRTRASAPRWPWEKDADEDDDE